MEINIYIANLGKYNEGELVGDWFTLPVDMGLVAEKIGLNHEYEEFAIHDYEAPFPIHEYENISKLNEIAEKIQEINDAMILKELKSLAEWIFSGDIRELVDKVDDFTYYDCSSERELGEYFITETGLISEIPTNLQSYFDYESYGRDLVLGGQFLETTSGYFEYIG